MRKERYVEGIAGKPVEAVRVSIADKLHNARMIVADHRVVGDELWDRFSASGPQTLWYYEALINAFDARRNDLGPGAIAKLDELRRTVEEMRRSSSPAEPSLPGARRGAVQYSSATSVQETSSPSLICRAIARKRCRSSRTAGVEM
ncbi:MAG: hypothetical protein R2700_10585 [Solirubrobacterales bacterium]